jgi:hypothetical protein
MNLSLAIAGSSGGLKGVFVQGVFKAFEAEGFYADAYAGSSASALPALSAAGKMCDFVGVHYWQRVVEQLRQKGADLSEVMWTVTREWRASTEQFRHSLFQPGAARLFIPANFVKNAQAAAQTQGEQARRLGRMLLLAIARRDHQWIDENLQMHLFDSQASKNEHRLTLDNMLDVAFASTRMIHWKIPAWVEGKPYVDASYTCACPAFELIEYGYKNVIVVSTEIGTAYRSILADQAIPEAIGNVPIYVIRPDVDLKTIGVDFAACTDEGLLAAFRHGEDKGHEFLAQKKHVFFAPE